MYNSRQLSTEVVSTGNYEIQIFKYVFHAYPSYLCSVSFLTILDIYKDYFKGRLRWCNLMQSDYSLKLWLETICPISSFFVEATASLCQDFCNQRVSWSSSFGWTKEFCNQHLSQVGVLVMYLDSYIDWLVTYWEQCIERRDFHYIASPIVY